MRGFTGMKSVGGSARVTTRANREYDRQTKLKGWVKVIRKTETERRAATDALTLKQRQPLLGAA